MYKTIYGVVSENGKKVRRIVVLGEIQCPICGKVFMPERQTTSYCSIKCSNRACYLKYHESRKEKLRKHYAEHKDEMSVSRKHRYWADPERYREYTRQYWAARKDKKQQKDAEYKDLVRHGGKRKLLIEQTGPVCVKCGVVAYGVYLQAHHVTKDKTDHEHQELLCVSCHAKEHVAERLNGRNKDEVKRYGGPDEGPPVSSPGKRG